MSDRHNYVKNLKSQIKQWDAQLEEYEVKLGSIQTEFKEGLDDIAVTLKDKRTHLLNSAQKLEESAEDAWEDLKDGVESSWESLKSGLSKAKAEFESKLEKSKSVEKTD